MAVVKEKKKAKKNDAVVMLAALAEETRLGIVKLLAAESKNVTDIGRTLNVEIVNVSHHLRILSDAGIIQGTRDGRMIFYSIDPNVFQDGVFDFGEVQVTLVK